MVDVAPWYRDPNGRARLLSTNAFCKVPADGAGEVPAPTKAPPKKKPPALPAPKPEAQTQEHQPDWLNPPPPEPTPEPDTPEPEDAELVEPEKHSTDDDARPDINGDAQGHREEAPAVERGAGAEPPPPPPEEAVDAKSSGRPEGDRTEARRELQAALHDGHVGFFYAVGLRYAGTPPMMRHPKTHHPPPITDDECERYEKALAAVIDRYGGESEHGELWALGFVTLMGLGGARLGAKPIKPKPEAKAEDEERDEEREDEAA